MGLLPRALLTLTSIPLFIYACYSAHKYTTLLPVAITLGWGVTTIFTVGFLAMTVLTNLFATYFAVIARPAGGGEAQRDGVMMGVFDMLVGGLLWVNAVAWLGVWWRRVSGGKGRGEIVFIEEVEKTEVEHDGFQFVWDGCMLQFFMLWYGLAHVGLGLWSLLTRRRGGKVVEPVHHDI